MEHTSTASQIKIYLYLYTDSVGFPRIDSQSSDVTWPFILADTIEKKYSIKVYVNHRGLGGGLIKDLYNTYKIDSGFFKSNKNSLSFVIFNIGIVDSAPRPFTYPIKKINKIPIVGRLTSDLSRRFLKPHRKILQQIYSYRLTSPRKFERLFSLMVKNVIARDMIPISLDTPLTPLRIEDISPGLRDSIKIYNKLKHKSQINHISCNWVNDSHLVDDGHHFNLKGNSQLAEKVFQIIDKKIKMELEN